MLQAGVRDLVAVAEVQRLQLLAELRDPRDVRVGRRGRQLQLRPYACRCLPQRHALVGVRWFSGCSAASSVHRTKEGVDADDFKGNENETVHFRARAVESLDRGF